MAIQTEMEIKEVVMVMLMVIITKVALMVILMATITKVMLMATQMV